MYTDERKIEMVSIDLLWLLWPILGITAGLIIANKVYAEDVGSTDRNFDTAMAFLVIAIFFPATAAGYICWLAFKSGAWILPAYRQEQRQLRENKEQEQRLLRENENANRTTELRKQINDMHAKIGIAPVDWTDKEVI
jgi:hypothetical protein